MNSAYYDFGGKRRPAGKVDVLLQPLQHVPNWFSFRGNRFSLIMVGCMAASLSHRMGFFEEPFSHSRQ